MSRKHDRRHTLKLVFQMEFFKDFEPSIAFERYFEAFCDEAAAARNIDKAFIEKEFLGTFAHKEPIDTIINENAEGWHVTRLSKTDLAILRLAVYEMFYADDVPAGVAINEAVELAKIFSSDDSPAFINGILGKISGKNREKK